MLDKATLTKYFKYLDRLKDNSMYRLSLKLQEDWGLRRLTANDILRHWVSSHSSKKSIEERVDITMEYLSKYSKTDV